MNEIKLALHIHTNYSDGNASHADLLKIAEKAGLDAIITTDHNILVNGFDGYHGDGSQKVMLIVGEEIHDRQLDPPGSHLLVIGAGKELAPFAADPQRLIDQVRRNEGLTFIAHPIEDPLERFNERAYSWQDWSVKNFTGIELWNQMSEFKSVSPTLSTALINALFPRRMTLGPLERTLLLWDDLIANRRQPVVAVGGVTHTNSSRNSGRSRSNSTPTCTTSGALEPISCSPNPSQASFLRIVDRSWKPSEAVTVLWLMIYRPKTDGFRFTVHNDDGMFIMGDQIKVKGGLSIPDSPSL